MVQVINNIKDVGSIISKMAAGMLADELQFIKTVDKEDADSFGQTFGYNHGDSININKPARFTVGSTADVTSAIQDVTEEKVSLTLDQRAVTAVNLTSAEVATDLALKSWAKRILKPAMSGMAQNIEANCLTIAKNNVANLVGTAGLSTFDTDMLLNARQLLKQNLVPSDDLYALVNSAAQRKASNARKGLFQASEELAKQYKRGAIGMADGFTWLENNLLPTHTNGGDVAFAVEASVVTIANGMSTLGVDGVGSGLTIKAGTTFTIDNVYAVHPITKVSTGELQQFVVTADVTEAGSNQVTLQISPAIYYTNTDPRQNVNAAPVDEATCNIVGAASTGYQNSLAFHPSAFRFASVPLMLPNDAHIAEQSTVDGITVRVWQASNVLTDKMILRLDVLYAFSAVRPEWAVRLTA
jgi:hypothetical protein